MSDFDPPEEPDIPTPPAPQEKRMGFLLIAFLIGLAIPSITLPFFLNARAKKNVQAEAVKAGHAVYKVIDEFGRTKFEWLPVPGMPAPEKK